MPYRLVCPRCHKLGFVRAERVIARGRALTHYFCGVCLYEWKEEDPPPPHNPPESTDNDS
jgi:rubredoxin